MDQDILSVKHYKIELKLLLSNHIIKNGPNTLPSVLK